MICHLEIIGKVKATAITLAVLTHPLSLANESISLPPPESPLSLLVYKMEILNYCGLIDDEISAGFGHQRDHIISELKLTEQQVQQARTEGWQSGLAEWQNRGLGGFKNWCRTDGREIAEYFRKIVIAVD
ncbi:MAG: hypothetical protein HKN34_09780 [Gammaproteobacteria bacterium]|nr:hypothetical protein [Gammaproteobacteria bacterium]